MKQFIEQQSKTKVIVSYQMISFPLKRFLQTYGKFPLYNFFLIVYLKDSQHYRSTPQTTSPKKQLEMQYKEKTASRTH